MGLRRPRHFEGCQLVVFAVDVAVDGGGDDGSWLPSIRRNKGGKMVGMETALDRCYTMSIRRHHIPELRTTPPMG